MRKNVGLRHGVGFLIQFCGNEVKNIFSSLGLNVNTAIGDLESVVIFMKAAASKNRIVDKVEHLLK